MVDISAAITNAQTTIDKGSNSLITGSKNASGNFDTFLTLLTTQLKNQDPTKPLDTNEFSKQLTQFSEVEQLIQSNQKLEALLKLSSASTSLSVIGYVGKQITSKGNTTTLANGSANWQLNMPASSNDVTYVIKDAKGNEVYSTNGSLDAGEGSFSWDGRTSAGGTAAPGNYSLTVTARDAAEKPINVGVAVTGIVDGVDMTGEAPVLLVNGARFNVGDVTEIHQQSRNPDS